MGNKSTFERKFNFWVGWISLISGIYSIISFGLRIYSRIKSLNITSSLIVWIIEHFAYIPLLWFIFCFIMNHFIIPWHKVIKEDISKEEAKPSYILSAILVITIIFCIAYIIILPDIKAYTITEEVQDTDETGDDSDTSNPVYDTDENTLEPFQQTVEEFVIRSSKEIVSIDEWRILSDEALYYIRNGIFAYSHVKYDKGFYDVYSWYSGTIDMSDFDWNVFNHYQIQNIENIKSVENERDTNNK